VVAEVEEEVAGQEAAGQEAAGQEAAGQEAIEIEDSDSDYEPPASCRKLEVKATKEVAAAEKKAQAAAKKKEVAARKAEESAKKAEAREKQREEARKLKWQAREAETARLKAAKASAEAAAARAAQCKVAAFDKAVAEVTEAAAAKAKAAVKKAALVELRRQLGALVNSKVEVAGEPGNWHIKAICHATAELSLEAFRAVVVPVVAAVTPPTFDESTPVVLAEVASFAQAVELLGSYNKLERSTSYVHRDGSSSSWKVDKMDLVFLPARRHLRLWWTMAGGR